MTRKSVNSSLLCLFTLALAACGNDGSPSQVGSGNQAANAPKASAPIASATTKRLAALQGNNICDIVSAAAIKQLFSPKTPVKSRPMAGKRRASCHYSWVRPDAEKRREAMAKARTESMQSGNMSKFRARDYSPEFTFSVTMRETHATPDNFVPRKLTDKELQAILEKAARRSDKYLSEKQKGAIGEGGAKRRAENMVRSANQRTVIDGVGDAAYWTPFGTGSLKVLIGNRELTITPRMADDESGNIEDAKKIYAAIVH